MCSPACTSIAATALPAARNASTIADAEAAGAAGDDDPLALEPEPVAHRNLVVIDPTPSTVETSSSPARR